MAYESRDLSPAERATAAATIREAFPQTERPCSAQPDDGGLGIDLSEEVDGVEPLQCAYWRPPDGDILLDGYFSLDELRAIVKYVEEHS